MTTPYTSTALALLFGLGVAVAGAPAGAQQSTPESMAREICDRNEDGFIDSQEMFVCGQARLDEMRGDAPHLTQQQFLTGYGDAEDAEGLFAEADTDQDQQLSQEEWDAWQEQRFGAATEASEGRMAVEDYERWDRGADLGGGG
jgi:hypothetical protein